MTASPVQPASAAMPSEEDVARALIAYFIDHTGFQTVDEDEKKTSVSASYGGIWVDLRVYPMARAVLALFAPILAEKEREKEAAIQVAEMNATAGAFWAERGKTAEARALAAEAALASKDEQLLIALAALKKIDEGCAAAIRAQGE